MVFAGVLDSHHMVTKKITFFSAGSYALHRSEIVSHISDVFCNFLHRSVIGLCFKHSSEIFV